MSKAELLKALEGTLAYGKEHWDAEYLHHNARGSDGPCDCWSCVALRETEDLIARVKAEPEPLAEEDHLEGCHRNDARFPPSERGRS